MTNRVETIAEGVTLYLGDCREILPTLGKVDAVVTDPPYGMDFRSNYRSIKHDAIANDNTADLLKWACGLSPRHSTYCFGRWDNVGDIPPPKSVLTWVKNNWSMGDLQHEHARQTEIILFYPGPNHDFPKGRPTDVLEAIRTGNGYHPTEKPIDLMERIIGFTRGTVLDPFMGSGTTGVAAVRAGRQFTGIEIEQKYFDIACRRIDEEWRKPRMLSEQQTPAEQIEWAEMWSKPFDKPELIAGNGKPVEEKSTKPYHNRTNDQTNSTKSSTSRRRGPRGFGHRP